VKISQSLLASSVESVQEICWIQMPTLRFFRTNREHVAGGV